MYRQKRRQQRKRITRRIQQKRKRETGGFLNRYDFAYASRDVVNQTAKAAPGVIKGATNYISNIAKQRIDEIISQERKEIERVLPKILRGAIGDVYQTPI